MRAHSAPEPDLSGVLVVDKPSDLTSHDVVAAARRFLHESRIGHTGTLDPLATGVLPLAIGRATRLVRFLVESDKEYDATILFGRTTDSYDITGTETSRSDSVPSMDDVVRAIGTLVGSHLQMPPAYSAKKVKGRRAYALARARQAVALSPVPVTVFRAELVAFDAGRARVSLQCSAGFYVRSFAQAIGQAVGTGACLEALRRTRSGSFSERIAVPLAALEDPARVQAALVPLAGLLADWPVVTTNSRGLDDVRHGRELEPVDYVGPASPGPGQAGQWVRVMDEQGALVAMATPGRLPSSLHPSVVLI